MNTPAPVSPSRLLLPLLVINFIGTVGFSLVLPFLVFLVTDWGGNAFVYGLAGATYSCFQLIGAPVLGRWSDRYGRRRVLLLSQAGTLVSWLVFLVAFALPETTLLHVDHEVAGAFVVTTPLLVLVLARALDGLTGGNVSVANAYLADVTSETERAPAFGKMAVSSNLGFVLGPAIAGLLGATALGALLPVVAAAVISLVATVLIAFRLPDLDPCPLSRSPEQSVFRKQLGQEQRDCYELGNAPRLTVGWLWAQPDLPRLMIVHFLVMLAFNFFYVTFPVFAAGILEWSIRQTGIFFAVLSLLMVIVQGPLYRRVAQRASEPGLVVAGAATLGVAFWLFDSRALPTISTAVALLALGNGVMWPSVLSLLSRAAGPTHQGAVQGLTGSLGAVASIAGLLLGGVLYAAIGPRVFWVSAGVTGVIVLVALPTLRRGRG